MKYNEIFKVFYKHAKIRAPSPISVDMLFDGFYITEMDIHWLEALTKENKNEIILAFNDNLKGRMTHCEEKKPMFDAIFLAYMDTVDELINE